jgi:hypothetical protein
MMKNLLPEKFISVMLSVRGILQQDKSKIFSTFDDAFMLFR